MPETAVHDPVQELRRENEVLHELLERFEAEASVLRSGKDVPPLEVAEGLQLLDDYVRIHVQRLDDDLRQAAREIVVWPCFEHLGKLLRDRDDASRLLGSARRALDRYEAGAAGSRAALTEALDDLSSRDDEISLYEMGSPLSCLVAALPDDTSKRLAERFGDSQDEVADLERHIREFLATPAGAAGSRVNVRCSQTNCTAFGSARLVLDHAGRQGMVAPEGGWRVVSQKVKLGGDGVARVRLDCLCPQHEDPGDTLELRLVPLAACAVGGDGTGDAGAKAHSRPLAKATSHSPLLRR